MTDEQKHLSSLAYDFASKLRDEGLVPPWYGTTHAILTVLVAWNLSCDENRDIEE